MPARTASLNATPKQPWRGRLLAIQPRIRLTRSFDERTHTYMGYALRLDGTIAASSGEFLVGVGPAAHARHRLRAGDVLSGESAPVADPQIEAVEFYKTAMLKALTRGPEQPAPGPPWHGIPPALEIYRERGHRRLDPRAYKAKCRACIWGCEMPVEMIIDPWKRPLEIRHRIETFCYGPKSCALYRPGPTRKVPGRRGMTWEEEDWVDEEATSHRPDDE